MRGVASPLWKSRILQGSAVGMGQGFELAATAEREVVAPEAASEAAAPKAALATAMGSGERWVLFQMDVELGEQVETIVVYSDDVAAEVSRQFVLKHDLGSDYIAVLETSIREQMNLAIM